MKRKYLAMVTLSALVLLSGCASSSDTVSASTSMSMPESAVVTTTTTASTSKTAFDTSDIQFSEDIKLVYTGELVLETTEFDAVAQSIYDLVGEYGGYFSNSNVNSYNTNYRSGDYTVRIPSESYYAFHQAVGALCLVTREQTTVEDISEVYYDTQGRLETQQIKLERLQNLLEQAETMEDIITIESAISDTQWQIDNLSGEMRHYDSIVDYATVDIYLNEVYQLSNVQETPKTFGDRLSNGFVQGGENFVGLLESTAVGLAYNWTLILIVVAVGSGVFIGRKRLVNKRKKSPSNPDESAK